MSEKPAPKIVLPFQAGAASYAWETLRSRTREVRSGGVAGSEEGHELMVKVREDQGGAHIEMQSTVVGKDESSLFGFRASVGPDGIRDWSGWKSFQNSLKTADSKLGENEFRELAREVVGRIELGEPLEGHPRREEINRAGSRLLLLLRAAFEKKGK